MGFLLVLLNVSLVVRATRARGKRDERARRAGLGMMAILSGPLVSAFLAWLANTLGEVLPADVKYTDTVYIAIGAISGLIAGVAFGITGLTCPQDSGASADPAKPVQIPDDL